MEAEAVNGYRAIHVAHSSVIPILLEAGADLEARTAFAQTPLMTQAVRTRTGIDVSALEILLEAGADPFATDMYGTRTARVLVEGFPDADAGVIEVLRRGEEGGPER